MARMDKSLFPIEGSLGKLSFYKIRGSDELIVRRKGGPTKEQIEKGANFVNTRRNNKEFGGRSKAAYNLMRVLRPFKSIGDYNLAGPLNAMLKQVQVLDTESGWGQRHVLLSKNPGLLQGLNLNKRTGFDSIITSPVTYTLSKELLRASVNIPALKPGINFNIPNNYPWYQLIISVGIADDVLFHPLPYDGYKTKGGDICGNETRTDWCSVYPDPAAITLETGSSNPEAWYERIQPAHASCFLTIGIAFGTMQNGRIEKVKYVGGAKILDAV